MSVCRLMNVRNLVEIVECLLKGLYRAKGVYLLERTMHGKVARTNLDYGEEFI